MGPRSDERGEFSGLTRVLAPYFLQWGRALTSAERPAEEADGGAVLFESSMGPRSDERGEHEATVARVKAFEALQWGRALTSAESNGDVILVLPGHAVFNGAAL